MRVLIVEDDIITAIALDQTIRAAGHRVLGPAATVSAAFALAEADPPDMAIVDVRLFHNDEAGYTLAEALQDRLAVPCILASGLPPHEIVARGIGLGVIAKPWLDKTIIATLDFVAALREGVSRPYPPEGLVLIARSEAHRPVPARFAGHEVRSGCGTDGGAPSA